MFARDHRLTFVGSAILIALGLLQLFAAFVPDGMYSWWHKTGAILMFVISGIYLVYLLVRRRDIRNKAQ